MRKTLGFLLALGVLAAPAAAAVIINEVFMNPPGSSTDDTREFIELLGTPGMKLDGYAIAYINGAQQRYYPLGSIPPRPIVDPQPEIDEFFSLDGLQLGPNGLLVIGIGASANYPLLLPDTHFRQWNTLWNGYRDTTGKLGNDGSTTVMLVRNRPGATQATAPLPPASANLIWGKDRNVDDELITPAIDPQDGIAKDLWGDGDLDVGQPNNIDGGNTFDAVGASTPSDLSDDLEVVDEVSHEHDRGWEYDVDRRMADLGSLSVGLPPRRVHALDDPQGINPDCYARVDYRTSGPGWPPAPGATGAMLNGSNWPDTATEQWVRGESIVGSGGQGPAPQFFFDNGTNANPDSIQPYLTNVPLWLADSVAPDYNFGTSFTYQIMAGRLNPLAVPFIPGDVDRDGYCDANDITKLRAVFGDADWIFSNAYPTAPQGDDTDPATQTRPWDVDGTGDNGIEPSDLQWTLNFQGSTTGRVVGRTYDSPTPETTGVHLNPNTGVVGEVTLSVSVPSGRPITGLLAGDVVELTVRGRVAAGANTAADQQNGIMQYLNDVNISTGGVLRITGVTALGTFTTTRTAIQSLQGASGDRGIHAVNGYTTSFTQGLTGAVDLYRVSLVAIGAGSANVAFGPPSLARYAASTPDGLKVGHTASNGNPAAVAYPLIGATVTGGGCGGFVRGDSNCDLSINNFDIDAFVLALTNPTAYEVSYPACSYLCNNDINSDGLVNNFDIDAFVQCLTSGCP